MLSAWLFGCLWDFLVFVFVFLLFFVDCDMMNRRTKTRKPLPLYIAIHGMRRIPCTEQRQLVRKKLAPSLASLFEKVQPSMLTLAAWFTLSLTGTSGECRPDCSKNCPRFNKEPFHICLQLESAIASMWTLTWSMKWTIFSSSRHVFCPGKQEVIGQRGDSHQKRLGYIHMCKTMKAPLLPGWRYETGSAASGNVGNYRCWTEGSGKRRHHGKWEVLIALTMQLGYGPLSEVRIELVSMFQSSFVCSHGRASLCP